MWLSPQVDVSIPGKSSCIPLITSPFYPFTTAQILHSPAHPPFKGLHCPQAQFS